MWVEIPTALIEIFPSFGHPLREDVSWNNRTTFPYPNTGRVILFVRMWVEIFRCKTNSTTKIVILFVRMWVEMLPCSFPFPVITVILFVRMWVEIEYIAGRKKVEYCHPLREDVSWNVCTNCGESSRPEVILFVRMWVEIDGSLFVFTDIAVILFVRMWVEMLWKHIQSWMIYVILFVRMWVEMLF